MGFLHLQCPYFSTILLRILCAKDNNEQRACFSVYQFFPTITMVILDNYFRTENFLNALDPL